MGGSRPKQRISATSPGLPWSDDRGQSRAGRHSISLRRGFSVADAHAKSRRANPALITFTCIAWATATHPAECDPRPARSAEPGWRGYGPSPCRRGEPRRELLVGDVVDVHLEVELDHAQQGGRLLQIVGAHDVDVIVQRGDDAVKPFGPVHWHLTVPSRSVCGTWLRPNCGSGSSLRKRR